MVRGLLGLLSASCSFKVRGFQDNEVEDEEKSLFNTEGVANAGRVARRFSV